MRTKQAMRLLSRALLVFAAGMVALLLAGCSGETRSGNLTIAIRYSRFLPGSVSVPAGVPVTIVLRNDDPIEHEWIVGTEEVHERHRKGTEAVHDQLPTEVTVPALSTRLTTLVFDEPAEYTFVCHLPGHEAYGMIGSVRVVGR